jgi:hypothetical protein
MNDWEDARIKRLEDRLYALERRPLERWTAFLQVLLWVMVGVLWGLTIAEIALKG